MRRQCWQDCSCVDSIHGPHLITQESPSTTPSHLYYCCHALFNTESAVLSHTHMEDTCSPDRARWIITLDWATMVTCSGGTGQIRDSDERREMNTGRVVHISLRSVGHAPEMSHREPEASASTADQHRFPKHGKASRSDSGERHQNKQTWLLLMTLGSLAALLPDCAQLDAFKGATSLLMPEAVRCERIIKGRHIHYTYLNKWIHSKTVENCRPMLIKQFPVIHFEYASNQGSKSRSLELLMSM